MKPSDLSLLMGKSTRSTILVKLTLYFTCTSLFVFSFLTSGNAEQLKVGVIAPLSGNAQSYGFAIKNGLTLAEEEINDLNIKLIFEDDGFIPSRTVTAFKKLAIQEKVDLIISVASTSSMAIAPLAEAAKLPLIAWASNELVSKKRKYVLRSWPSGKTEGMIAASEAKRRGHKTAASIIAINDYGASVREGFYQSFPREILVLNEEYQGTNEDFRPALIKLKAKNPDVLLGCVNPGQVTQLAKQIKQLNIVTQLVGCENFHSMDEVNAAEGALSGALFATAPVTDEFRIKYQKRFGNEDIISGAAVHYDIYNLLHRFGNIVSREELLKKLLTSGLQHGAVGPFRVTEVEGDQFFDLGLVVKEITASGFKVIEIRE